LGPEFVMEGKGFEQQGGKDGGGRLCGTGGGAELMKFAV